MKKIPTSKNKKFSSTDRMKTHPSKNVKSNTIFYEELPITTQEIELTSDSEKMGLDSQELDSDSQELDSDYEELESDYEELESDYEELESGSDELDSSSNKLESGSEELKSGSQELDSDSEKLEAAVPKTTLPYISFETAVREEAMGSSKKIDERLEEDFPVITSYRSVIGSLEIPEFSVSSREWKWAKEQQKIKHNEHKEGFKIRRKDRNAKKQEITHSFLSINKAKAQPKEFFSYRNDKNNKQELYCLAPKGQYLGKGKFGKVKLAINKEGEYVAVKIQSASITKKEEIELMKEMGIYHGDMVRKAKKDVKEYQVIEYLGVSLNDLIESGIEDITPEERYKIGMGILKALKELHEKDFLHCDLHPGNVLVSIDKDLEKIKISLVDFGFSKKLNGQEEIPATGKANLNIIAPEIYNSSKMGPHPYFSKKSDMYAVGLIFEKLGFNSDRIKESHMLDTDPTLRTTTENALDYFRENKKATIAEMSRPGNFQKRV